MLYLMPILINLGGKILSAIMLWIWGRKNGWHKWIHWTFIVHYGMHRWIMGCIDGSTELCDAKIDTLDYRRHRWIHWTVADPFSFCTYLIFQSCVFSISVSVGRLYEANFACFVGHLLLWKETNRPRLLKDWTGRTHPYWSQNFGTKVGRNLEWLNFTELRHFCVTPVSLS